VNLVSAAPPPGGKRQFTPLWPSKVKQAYRLNVNTQCVPNVRKGHTDRVRSQTNSDLRL